MRCSSDSVSELTVLDAICGMLSSMDVYTHLAQDPVMKKLIKIYGKIGNPRQNAKVNLYKDIIESIVSQQLSVKAADTIMKRFLSLFGDILPTPTQVIQMPDEQIRACGISYSKIKYIKGVCQAVNEGNLDLATLKKLPDEEVAEQLISLKGIGKWTAEMILIFSLHRQDIFSLGDMGLRNAISKLYNVSKDDDKALLRISDKWKPYRSIACRYLWKSLDNEPI